MRAFLALELGLPGVLAPSLRFGGGAGTLDFVDADGRATLWARVTSDAVSFEPGAPPQVGGLSA